jgi:hypothetical protein
MTVQVSLSAGPGGDVSPNRPRPGACGTSTIDPEEER